MMREKSVLGHNLSQGGHMQKTQLPLQTPLMSLRTLCRQKVMPLHGPLVVCEDWLRANLNNDFLWYLIQVKELLVVIHQWVQWLEHRTAARVHMQIHCMGWRLCKTIQRWIHTHHLHHNLIGILRNGQSYIALGPQCLVIQCLFPGYVIHCVWVESSQIILSSYMRGSRHHSKALKNSIRLSITSYQGGPHFSIMKSLLTMRYTKYITKISSPAFMPCLETQILPQCWCSSLRSTTLTRTRRSACIMTCRLDAGGGACRWVCKYEPIVTNMDPYSHMI